MNLFLLEGKPVGELATEGQIEIFHTIVYRLYPRAEIITSTQYGKSLFIALACLVVSCVEGELIAIVAPTDEKAKFIMRYFVEHLGDNILFYSQIEKNTKLERLRMEESKERIILRNGGGIYVLSAQAGNSQKGIEAAMGAGAKIVILDEAGLVPDAIEATIFRMIAGKGEDAFYCKVGNPYYRNHFLKSWRDPSYHRVFIDYTQGLEEGRYNLDFIKEARTKPYFDILFACKFPKEDQMVGKGFLSLFSEDELAKAQEEQQPFGEQRMGGDVAEGGGDANAIVKRWANIAKVVLEYRGVADTMTFVGNVILQANMDEQNKVLDRNIFIDGIGVGKGAVDRLHEQKWLVHQVKFSERADDPVQYSNLRAECYWRLKQWVSAGGKLFPDPRWKELLSIKYKADESSGKLKIMSKDDMRRIGLPSPNIADALAMTFARKSVINPKAKEEKEVLKQFDAHTRSRAPRPMGSPYPNSY